MEAKFEYNPEEIMNIAANIANCTANMSDFVMSLRKDVQALGEEWQSDASKKFIENYNELYNRFDKVIQAVGNVEQSLVAIAQNIVNSEPEV